MADQGLIATAINVFAAPNDAFAVIRERPRPVFPLALLLLGLIVTTVVYMNLVDLPWFIENQIRSSPAADELSDAEIATAVDRAGGSPGVVATFASITSSVFITIVYVVFSLYLWAASSIGRHGIRFIQAFALVCWCALPGLLGFIAAFVNIVANDATFMSQPEINPLSFSTLFGVEAAPGSVSQQILLGLDLTAIWAAVLMVLGYKAWSERSLAVAASIVLAPYALLIGLALVNWN